MLNDQEQERFMRLWTESQQAVVNYIDATVRDPAAAVVDLSTEFVVKAGPGIGTDVQVYQGVVITTSKPASVPGGFPQPLTAGNAARFPLDANRAPQHGAGRSPSVFAD